MAQRSEKAFQARSNRTLYRVGASLAGLGFMPFLYGWGAYCSTEGDYSAAREDCALYNEPIPSDCQHIPSYKLAESNEGDLMLGGFRLAIIGSGFMAVASLRRCIGQDEPDIPPEIKKEFHDQLAHLIGE